MASRRKTRAETRTGRRPLLLDTTTRETLLTAIASGVPVTHAATRAGIAVSTLMAWTARGRAARERTEATPPHPPEPDDDLYAEFLEAVERARADAVVGLVATVQKAARGGYIRSERTYTDEQGRLVREKTYADVDWRAAQFILERSFRSEFGKSSYVDVNLLGPGALGLPEPVQGQIGSGAAGLDERTVESLAEKVMAAARLREEERAFAESLEDVVDADVVED